MPEDPPHVPDLGLSDGAELALCLLDLGDALAEQATTEGSQQHAVEAYVAHCVPHLRSIPSAVLEAKSLLRRLWQMEPTNGRLAAVIVLDQISRALDAEQPIEERLSEELDRRIAGWLA